ncbi:MAG: hypothetical protein ACD_20C00053G0003 [uncultured bacterium]|nr:MAG: hypothetical protein ACD_20C00053G0003 [uncultured bacterium]
MIKFNVNFPYQNNNLKLNSKNPQDSSSKSNAKSVSFNGDTVVITQEKTLDKPGRKKYTLRDIFIPNFNKITQESRMTLSQGFKRLYFDYIPTKNHNIAEEYKTFSHAVYTAIIDAKKSDAKEIRFNAPNNDFSKIANSLGFEAVSSKELVLPEKSYDKVLKAAEDIVKSNIDELDGINQRAKKFEFSKVMPLLGLNTKPITLGPSGNIRIGENDSSMKDVQATLSMQDGKVFIQNTGKLQNKMRILGESYVDTEKSEIFHGDTIQLGDELYLFTYKDSKQPELRFLTIDQNGSMEILFPKGFYGFNFKQGSIGDCYFLSALKSLSINPKGVELLSRMIEPISNGEYKVTFPGFPKEDINVNIADLNQNGIKKAPLGVKILEDAFYKLRKRIQWTGTVSNPKNKQEWLTGGFGEEASHILTGGKYYTLDTIYKGKYFSSFKDTARRAPDIIKDLEDTLKYLKEEGNNFIITAKTGQWKEKLSVPQDFDEIIVSGHVYSVAKINPEERKLVIINPHDTSKAYWITYDVFFKYFDSLDAVKLKNTDKLYDE